MRQAWKTRKPVEILAERTETSQTFANPDGTLRTREHATPVRVRRGSDWVPVDEELKTAGGAVVPKATALDVRFSAGGSGPMLTLTRGERSLAISWPGGDLPTPVLTGNTATYAEVLPGVDLQLAAYADSFSQVLVVKTPVAATNTALRELRFGLAANGITMRQDGDGFIQAMTPDQVPLFFSDGARMWDKPQAPAAAQARAKSSTSSTVTLPQGPESRRVEDLPVHLDDVSLTVIPSQAMLADPNTAYPVSIDPGFNGGKEIWTHVSRKNPTKSYWTDSATRDDMRVGQLWGGTDSDDWRTIVQFNTSVLVDATAISKASVHVNVRHSADCTPSPLQLYRTNWINSAGAVTWDNTKDKTWTLLGTVNATANKSACPKGNDEVRFAQTAIKTAFENVARNDYTTLTLAFRAQSESDAYQWKKLVPDSTYLDVVYNRQPGTPSNLGFSPCYAACGNGTAVTSSKRPKLSMKAVDPDGGILRYEYEVYASNKTTRKATSGTSVTGVGSGSLREWAVQSDLPDGDYYWRGRACDTFGCGLDSAWFGFKVDTANPGNPGVTSEKYPPTGWNGGPGQAGTFVFAPGSAGDAVKYYTYSLNGGAENQIAPSGGSGVASRDLTPTKDLVNTLRVKAIDTAGNLSGAVDYVFKVKPVGESWYWALNEGTGTTAASAPENNRPATVSGTGVMWSEAGKSGESAATFDGTGNLSTTSTVFNTLSPAGFTVAAWVRLPAPPPPPETGDEDEQPELPSPLPAGNRFAVSQDGANTSMFTLGYRTDVDVDGDGVNDSAWCFSVAATDTADADTKAACTTDYVEAGSWAHLVGIVDPATDLIQLYVNGIPAADGVRVEKPGHATWEAIGKFGIGRGWAGAADTQWVGEIDEVHATPRVWSDQEIFSRAQAE
ncbi:hypothetical protein Aca07nite_62480 [Actinoplanes capillaceus]|uniref:LamG-like jellyroll fold domain-containing protein n=2 Tax=Actinoplanes campanulatus TaxID=113559 RepID=A0ABQ3WRP8_9ACTN|nr:hypothetical protein Aca07nite_62480 [Actinoplanes capillaceus]